MEVMCIKLMRSSHSSRKVLGVPSPASWRPSPWPGVPGTTSQDSQDLQKLLDALYRDGIDIILKAKVEGTQDRVHAERGRSCQLPSPGEPQGQRLILPTTM